MADMFEEAKKNPVFHKFDYDKIPVVDLVNQIITDSYQKRAALQPLFLQ